MFRIALAGAPGSGKSALAHTLKNALEREDVGCADCRTPIAVVDEYVEPLQDHTDRALGFNANYIGNLHVALERERLERIARADHKTVITCGTLLETSAYTAQEVISQLPFDNEAEKEDDARRVEAAMKTVACLYMDTFHYDYLFYLPVVHPPAPEAMEDVKTLDRNLQSAFAAFNLVPAKPLTKEGDGPLEVAEKRCAEALKEILG